MAENREFVEKLSIYELWTVAFGNNSNTKMHNFLEILPISNLKNKLQFKKIRHFLNNLGSHTGKKLINSRFLTFSALVKLHPTKRKHWVFNVDICFWFFGRPPPQNVCKCKKSKHRKCIYSEYLIRKNTSICDRFCLQNSYCLP